MAAPGETGSQNNCQITLVELYAPVFGKHTEVLADNESMINELATIVI